MANNQNRNRDQQNQQGEGYQDQNEREPRDSRRSGTASEPLTSETVGPESERLDELDELDEDRDDDERESGPNRRFNIG